jgi:hypothetical protein
MVELDALTKVNGNPYNQKVLFSKHTLQIMCLNCLFFVPSVGIATDYGLDDRGGGSRVRVPVG